MPQWRGGWALATARGHRAGEPQSQESAAAATWQTRSLSAESESCPGCDCIAPTAIAVVATVVAVVLHAVFVGYFRKPAVAWRCLQRIVMRRASSAASSVDAPNKGLVRPRCNSKAEDLAVTLTEEQTAQLEGLAADARADLLPVYVRLGERLLRDGGKCLLYSSDLRFRIGKGGEGDVFRSMLLHLPSGPSAQESEASLAYKVVAYKVRSCLPHMHGSIERVRIDRLTDNKLLDMPQCLNPSFQVVERPASLHSALPLIQASNECAHGVPVVAITVTRQAAEAGSPSARDSTHSVANEAVVSTLGPLSDAEIEIALRSPRVSLDGSCKSNGSPGSTASYSDSDAGVPTMSGLVMEWFPLGDLRSAMAEGKLVLTRERILSIAQCVASYLSDLHTKHRALHRDIKVPTIF